MNQQCNRCKKTKQPCDFGGYKECTTCRQGRRSYYHDRGGKKVRAVTDKLSRQRAWYGRMVRHSKEADIKSKRMPEDISSYVDSEFLILMFGMQDGRCAYCEKPMQTLNRRLHDGCTIQREDNSNAHLTHNVVLCCFQCQMEDRWYNY